MRIEKIAALNEAWAAMTAQAFLENQKFTLAFMRSLWFPWMRAVPRTKSVSTRARKAAERTLGKGLAPFRRRVTANTKRLGRIRRK